MFVKLRQVYNQEVQAKGLNSPILLWAFMITIPILTIVQLVTCGMVITGNPPQVQVLGIKTYIGTIAIQEVLVLCLFVMVIIFCSNMATNAQRMNRKWPRWKIISFALLFSLGAISLRTAYRMIELLQVFQANSILAHSEIFFYSFEAVPILAALSVWTVVDTGDLTRPSSMKLGYRELREPPSDETIPLTTVKTVE